MDFSCLVCKWGVKYHIFVGLKSGQDLKNRATHPHQEFPPPPSGTRCTLTRVHVCTWGSISLWSNEEGNYPDNESLKTKVPAHLLAIQYRWKNSFLRGSVHDQVYIYQVCCFLRRKFVGFAAPEDCRYYSMLLSVPLRRLILVASRAFFGDVRLSVRLTPVRNSSLEVVSF